MNEAQRGLEWLDGIVDSDLRWHLRALGATRDLTSVIRTAFVYLEDRIRDSAGLTEYDYGKDLIDKAFHPDIGILQPVSPVGSERAGLYNLLLGIFLYYRNPVAHRPVYYTEESARQVVFLIDHALQLVERAIEAAFDIKAFVGDHEGQILGRRDYRLDIDGDGELEIVMLLVLGAATDGSEIAPHLRAVVLKKVKGQYRRVPSEWVKGFSIYGGAGVEARYITNLECPDIVASWTWGETQVLKVILRRDGDRYVVVRLEIPPGMKQPYSGPLEFGFGVHGRQPMALADVDGDGLDEMVQTLGFDDEDMEALGHPVYSEDGRERYTITRVWKWDDQKSHIVQIDERLVAFRRNDNSA